MELAQEYETIVADRHSGLAVHYIVLPARSLDDVVLENERELLERLELKLLLGFESPRLLVPALVSLLEKDGEGFDAAFGRLKELIGRGLFGGVDGEIVRFAEHAAFARLIPFEGSFELESLVSIAAKASEVGGGAILGYAAAAGSTPLVFVTVPLGIVLVGAAAGVAGALREGLRYKLLRLLRVPERKRK